MNYTESMAKGFAFLSVVVTAANLPLYLFCAHRDHRPLATR